MLLEIHHGKPTRISARGDHGAGFELPCFCNAHERPDADAPKGAFSACFEWDASPCTDAFGEEEGKNPDAETTRSKGGDAFQAECRHADTLADRPRDASTGFCEKPDKRPPAASLVEEPREEAMGHPHLYPCGEEVPVTDSREKLDDAINGDEIRGSKGNSGGSPLPSQSVMVSTVPSRSALMSAMPSQSTMASEVRSQSNLASAVPSVTSQPSESLWGTRSPSTSSVRVLEKMAMERMGVPKSLCNFIYLLIESGVIGFSAFFNEKENNL